jgi:hypothetical protein
VSFLGKSSDSDKIREIIFINLLQIQIWKKNPHTSNYRYSYGDLLSPEKAAQNRREFLTNKTMSYNLFFEIKKF